MKTRYRQCEIHRKTETGHLIDVAWLPEKFSVVGKVLKIKDKEEWSDGWIVVSVRSFALDEQDVPDLEREYKSHRSRTDI